MKDWNEFTQDNFPPIGMDVLVVVDPDALDQPAPKIYVGKLTEICHVRNALGESISVDWSIYTSIGTCDLLVTYWRYLPEPPKTIDHG